MEAALRAIYELVPVIGDVIDAHCPGTTARSDFMRACLRAHWDEAKGMIEGMLAEPWMLRGYQESRLREFLELLPMTEPAARAAAPDDVNRQA
jgi:hypothetical protein